eukprot:TRINITY_DN5872_c0_g1_i1.p1 TRINITY_DN5872_c0_g1~~TRINITY_DN5872_c0_g1_i1.p1  ORF type:complete len:409 (+),score=69.67 TRINITY_DN5872_c0_g1_i1:54-1229(+)
MASGITELPASKHGVAIALPTRSEGLILQLASSRAYLPCYLLEPTDQAVVLEKQLQILNPGILIAHESFLGESQLEMYGQIFPHFSKYNEAIPINDVRFPNLRHVLLYSKRETFPIPNVQILLNSLPDFLLKRDYKFKGTPSTNITTTFINKQFQEVTITEHSILNTANAVGSIGSLNEEDIVLTTLPPYRTVGLSLGLGLALTQKVKFVWCSEVFDADATVAALTNEYCTVLISQPDELDIIIDKYDVSQQKQRNKSKQNSLKKIFIITTPGNLHSPQLITRLKERFDKVSITVTFGTDDTSGVITTSQYHHEGGSTHQGKPLPNTEIQIVDSNGKEVPVGTCGELLVKGFNVPTYRDPSMIKQKFLQNGYFQTGVTAKLDNNHNLVITS